jgi:hypothetical protein
MPVATVFVPDRGTYRHDAFISGLKILGYHIGRVATAQPGNVLVVWNRRRAEEGAIKQYEAVGGIVIVTENGWIGSDPNGNKMYALCLNHHNGAGRWHVGEEDRWSKLGIGLRPWRSDGDHILVLPQRGFGEPGVAMPMEWPRRVVERLRKVTRRPIKVRVHPGPSKASMDPDLKNAWAAVTWASGAGIKAIVAGIPVFHDMPEWIGAPAAKHGIEDIENPFLGDRMPMLHRMSWAQWSADEISTGEPLRGLLELT